MANHKVIRAWKDPAYRNSLSQAERAALPANPAGTIEISDADHGFFCDARPAYKETAAKQAWELALKFLATYVR